MCPECGQRSSRVNCSYNRTLADMPVAGCRLEVRLWARRFTCGNAACWHWTSPNRLRGY
ncbi:transposase family protein [Streptomyces sp. NPDC006703]|uniref:transposase family protein n=1 Tax=Streptomyces sp. NPDC006703 TaxID=3364759 RepID=UPI0036CA715C